MKFLLLFIGVLVFLSGCIDNFGPDYQKVSLSFTTNTETYSSGELMELVVRVNTTKILNGTLRVQGIPARGTLRINELKNVLIGPPGNETSFLIRMPSCYGCAGISPGDYEVECLLEENGKVIANFSKTISLEK